MEGIVYTLLECLSQSQLVALVRQRMLPSIQRAKVELYSPMPMYNQSKL